VLQEPIHFVGIGGTGMSAIADILLCQGRQVSGSDLVENTATKRLQAKGAQIFRGHRAENVAQAALLVVSAAVPRDNPELLAARQRGIPVIQRGEMLGRLMAQYQGVAVAGTHGKTTTTSMVALILERAGLDPTVLVGGELNDIGGNAKLGYGPYLVTEADESDGSFLLLTPQYAVVTNVEADHLDNYRDLGEIQAAFAAFLQGQPANGAAVLCADDKTLRGLADQLPNAITYAVHHENAHYRALAPELEPFSARFGVSFQGQYLGTIRLGIPGLHNVANALGALAVTRAIGVDFDTAAAALAGFRGVKRRFQTLAIVNGVRVMDDYGHHPTEVAATLAAARNAATGRVICLFQPHRYSRTKHLAEQFAATLREADCLLVTDIYAAGEEVIPGVSARQIVDAIVPAKGQVVEYVPQKEALVSRTLQLAQPGDLVLTLGAGDIWRTGVQLVERLAGNPNWSEVGLVNL
jgi:UDP-N-acetylmuramate--alanine ligase